MYKWALKNVNKNEKKLIIIQIITLLIVANVINYIFYY